MNKEIKNHQCLELLNELSFQQTPILFVFLLDQCILLSSIVTLKKIQVRKDELRVEVLRGSLQNAKAK